MDDSSLSSSAQSLLALLAHFEPITSGGTRAGTGFASSYSANRSSLFSRLTAPTRFAPSLRAQGVAFEDSAEIAVIRRVALAMANRTKALERELALAKTDAWTAKEQSRVLIADMQATHAQLTQLHTQSLEHEKARVARLEEEHTQDLNALRRLEDQLNQMTALKNSMVSREEFDGLRNAREEIARTARDLDSQLTSLKHLNASEREKAALNLSQAIEVRENKLSAFNQRLHASADENTQLHHVIQKKTADLATMERSLGEAASLHEELARNLELTLSKNGQLAERIRVLEGECQEHRVFSQKMKSASVQFESSKAQSEATLHHLQSELREKERELQKSQEMVRTLTAATRAAANELDSQMAYSKSFVRRPAPAPQSSVGHTPQQQPSFNPYSPTRSARQGGGSYLYSAAPAGSLQQHQPQPAPPQSQQINAGPSTIHLRHHPGGRLSMDVTRAAVSAAGLDQPPQQQQDFLSFQQPPRLQSSSSYPQPSPSDSSQPLRFDDLPTHAGASSAPSSAYLQRHADPAASSSSASSASQAAATSGRVEREQ